MYLLLSKILITNFRFYLITCGYNVYNLLKNLLEFLVAYLYPLVCKSSVDKPLVNSIKRNTSASLSNVSHEPLQITFQMS